MTDNRRERVSVGVCYFPEHWPRDRWETDVRRMAEAGFEYVRMGEFAWSELEPRRGAFDAGWLREAVDLVDEHGMRAVLCTPTAAPPKWLVDEIPGMLPEDARGNVQGFGGRRHYCFNSDAYREESVRITGLLAAAFADHDAVVGWQTDNEYPATARCYCEDCAEAFREWLRDRYGTVETLNEAWGTTFWSQRYDDFAEVDLPRATRSENHPSRLLDFYRFSSDSVAAFNREQVATLRDAGDWWVTHNFVAQRFSEADTYDVAEDLDLVAWDSYPTGTIQLRDAEEPSVDQLRAGDPDHVALDHDVFRGHCDRPFWIMEQQPGDINWGEYNPHPADGAMRLWAHHAVAHGAETVMYFRWRRCREGQEQYHSGLRKRDGSADVGYREASEAAAELEDLPHLAPVDAPVAILHDYENSWALADQPHAPDFDYWEHLGTYHSGLRKRGVQVDAVHPETDLSGYAAVVAPTLYLVGDELADHLASYVEDGGQLLATIRTGHADPHNKLHDALAPGPLADLFGTSVTQQETFAPAMPTRLRYRGEEYAYRTFGEWLDPDGADPVGTHVTGRSAGEPAITRADVGSGTATYVGVWPSRDLADAFIEDLLDAADVDRVSALPSGVRINERDGLSWVTNFTSEAVEITAPPGATWLVGDETVGPFDLAVVEAPFDDLDVALR